MSATMSVIAAPIADAAEVAVEGGHLDWGVKASFRSYITGPIAAGSISVTGGATTNADGTFRFPVASGTHDSEAATSVAVDGAVHFTGHDGELDMAISDIRVTLSGGSGTLTADVESRALGSEEIESYPDVVFANLTPGAPASGDGTVAWTAIPAALTAAGSPAFAGFYPAGTDLDPVTVDLQVEEGDDPEPTTPTVVVSKAVVNPDGDTVTVSGTGFDPALATGTRPPLSGRPAGVYVAFGSFADVWRPSQGAPSSARPTPAQATGAVKWAVLAADRATVGEANSVTLNPDGSFTATLNVADYATAHADGNYGIYTYAGSGAVAAAYETYTPLTLSNVSASQTITTTVVDTGALTISVAGDEVVLPSPELTEDGTALATSGAINPVTVTDLRTADPGWSLSGQLSDFAGPAGASLPGNTLGWTPSLQSSSAGQNAAAGPSVAPNSGAGLSGGSLLGSAVVGAGRGTAVFGADVDLVIPTSTEPGTYSAVLTLTAI